MAISIHPQGVHGYIVRRPLGRERREPEPEYAPEPYSSLWAFEIDIEGRVDEHGRPVDEQPAVDLQPEDISSPPGPVESAKQADSEDPLERDPEKQPWHPGTSQYGQMAVVRVPKSVIGLYLKTIIIGQVDAESLAGPEVWAMDSVGDDSRPPTLAPVLCPPQTYIAATVAGKNTLDIAADLRW